MGVWAGRHGASWRRGMACGGNAHGMVLRWERRRRRHWRRRRRWRRWRRLLRRRWLLRMRLLLDELLKTWELLKQRL
jgi:hypothetical protein